VKDSTTTQRFGAGPCGRKSDGSINYGVGDTMRPRDSDGRCADFDTLESAQAWAAELNARWARELSGRSDGCQWLPVPGRYFYAWLLPVKPFDYYID